MSDFKGTIISDLNRLVEIAELQAQITAAEKQLANALTRSTEEQERIDRNNEVVMRGYDAWLARKGDC